MSRPKYNEPCPCGSGKKYRNCHLQADREAREAEEATPLSPPPERGLAPPPPRPAWLRALPWIVGVLGVGAGVWIASTWSQQAGIAVAVGALTVSVLIAVLGDPPPPRDDAGDPGAINFGR